MQNSAPRFIKTEASVSRIRLLDLERLAEGWLLSGDISQHSQRTLGVRRDEAILLFLLDTGLRATEACSLKFGDVDMSNYRAIVLGKGNKRRSISFSKTTAKSLWNYLREDEREPTDPLFQSERGEALTRSGLQQLMERLVDALIATKTRQRTVIAPTPAELTKATLTAATRGVNEAISLLRYGEKGAEQKGMEPIGSISHDFFAGEIHTKSRIADAYINAVSRMHGAAYRPFKVFAFTRALQEQARLQARAEGVPQGAHFTQRVNALLDDPTPEMAVKAIEAAENEALRGAAELAEAVLRSPVPAPVLKDPPRERRWRRTDYR